MPIGFQELIDSYYQNLYRYALSISGSQENAWDLTQETFLIWARKGSTIRSEKATKSWLYTTLYREFLKLSKRSNRVVALEDQSMNYETIADDENPLPHFEAENVMDLLIELKLEYRKVVTLYYLESYSYKEISKILDIPIGTVMSRLARGKDVLRRKLRNENEPNNIVAYSKLERVSGDE